MIFMDLDDFKLVNDTFGHACGDALLAAVGDRLKACLRASDTAARLGGDEFAILLEDVDEAVNPAEVAERILQALQAPLTVEEKEFRIGASLGIAFGTGEEGTKATEELLRNADVSMYTAKGQGKHRYAIYEPTMHKSMLQHLELKGDLQRALDNQEFELHYQPLFNLETQQISSVEALVRWEHPKRGTVPPGEFIHLAEETGLIIPLGSWVLETACREAQRLQERFPQEPPLSMSVNLSSRQLQWPGIVADVRNALTTSGLPPASLTLEVTESAMMENVELSILRLEELRALGVRIAIDDFGTGYSSLSYIKRFPVDTLKVDKSFIDRIEEGGEELALVGATIDLARVLDLRPGCRGNRTLRAVREVARARLRLRAGLLPREAGAHGLLEERLSEQTKDLAA